MRLKPGRPDLRDHARYFDVPAAGTGAPLTVTWAGVATLLISDGTSALLTDGFFSRPGLLTVALRRIALSETPQVRRDHAIAAAKRLHLPAPTHSVIGKAMQEDDRRARARRRVVQFDVAVDRDPGFEHRAQAHRVPANTVTF